MQQFANWELAELVQWFTSKTGEFYVHGHAFFIRGYTLGNSYPATWRRSSMISPRSSKAMNSHGFFGMNFQSESAAQLGWKGVTRVPAMTWGTTIHHHLCGCATRDRLHRQAGMVNNRNCIDMYRPCKTRCGAFCVFGHSFCLGFCSLACVSQLRSSSSPLDGLDASSTLKKSPGVACGRIIVVHKLGRRLNAESWIGWVRWQV